MRYLTKLCDQVVALLSPKHSASISFWDEEDSDAESEDVDAGDSKRVFRFEVAETSEQESAVALPGFQINSRYLASHEIPPSCPVDPSVLTPRLLPGETTQGFMTASHNSRKKRSQVYSAFTFTRLALKQLLADNALALSDCLDEDAVQILVTVAIAEDFPEQCDKWHVINEKIRIQFKQELEKREDEARRELAGQLDSLRYVLRGSVVGEVTRLFPSLERDRLSSRFCDDLYARQGATNLMQLSKLESLYPDFRGIYQSHVQGKFNNVLRRDPRFESLKLRLISIRRLLEMFSPLDQTMRSDLRRAVLDGDFQRAWQVLFKTKNMDSIVPSARSVSSPRSRGDPLKNEMRKLADSVSDSQFLIDIKAVEDKELRSTIKDVEQLAHYQLSVIIDKVVDPMARDVLEMQQRYLGRVIQRQTESEKRKVLNDALKDFIRDINAQSVGRGTSVISIDRIDLVRSIHSRSHGQEYAITGRREAYSPPELAFQVHAIELTRDDMHNMQLDPKYIPNPAVNDRLSSTFHLPIHMHIVFNQILENQKLLLILHDGDGIFIYLERLPAMDMAIQRRRTIKRLSRERLGNDLLFAFDETKRMLAMCATTELQLHIFVFDEEFKTLHGQGSFIDLASWYSKAGISIVHAAFVCGSEEVVLVDSCARARIFSFVTLQFRPASVQFLSLPKALFSSPDGSCFLVLHTHNSKPSLTAYHWETFGSTDGIQLEVPKFPLQGAVLTSMVGQGRVFLVGLDIDAGSIQSIAIDITTKRNEFMFREKGGRNAPDYGTRHTLHNSLLDCHAEVWFRFPVVPTMSRRTFTSSSKRKPKTITFIADNHSQPFSSYFSNLIKKFKATTKKPTGDELRGIKVSAAQFGPFREVFLKSNWDVSRYCLGEWLVDLLCLIPIHIAVCRENTFIPLADGVLSAELERSLLGAEVNQIVDKLSFGWYESIFQSYLATKPVKVVSSMGQQSVGKSFSLNHFLDTSFAGSAMRTTEGVWMSVTPTDDALIVALDFEGSFVCFQSYHDRHSETTTGVGSVERTLQEDTLLVLFNTAISNLVLFRNNFSFGRDISGLFQSFQASASLLDPAANESLFQSTLVIIIKASLDVVESDTAGIRQEFSLKFQQIVQQEQKSNFISRLHRGKLDIIPWPVIESKVFYKVFSDLKKGLDRQQISHPTAYEFLHTIKTLMAKLKANDWRALSQTMAEHRAGTLSSLLPMALVTGHSEIEPDLEPLKNFDNDLLVEADDTATYFPISGCEVPPADIERRLVALRESWNTDTPRQSIPDSDWTSKFASHISGLIDLRVNHVRFWLDSNLERFRVGGHATVDGLRRTFNKMVIEMKSNVQLCRVQCSSCHLLCIRSHLHDGEHSCETNHRCIHNCAFCEDEPKPCGTSAGHPGQHVCAVNTHLCGKKCKLLGKRGCLEACTKVAWHEEDEHICSALVHMCGKPCALLEIKLSDGKTYSCQGGCSIPSDQHHDVHSCDKALCPVACKLCMRLCVQPHLHGLSPDVVHLCSEAHSCYAQCSAPGICQIDTTPFSIEDTFTGRHGTFQYTKYSQVSKRLQCIKIIEPGQVMHTGDHIHTEEKRPLHYCEARSSSMRTTDHKPLDDTPAAKRIRFWANNRLGAVYSALYSFWSARDVAVNAGNKTVSTRRVGGASNMFLSPTAPARRRDSIRRDAYSAILFNRITKEVLVNDSTSSPDELLTKLLREEARGQTDFSAALRAAEAVMVRNWSAERTPIMIFLSDGINDVSDEVIRDVCQSATRLGKPLSFHAVSFGDGAQTSILRRMAQLALEIQNNARVPSVLGTDKIPSSFTTALDTVRLTATFIAIAESFKKPRASLMR
ncbi:hypothetical protein BJV78DRAFT_1361975 [Lactifluus subvellereus]|nr:hypothetical protein BJV78DRAFT_1361975 [Lactifluus subvellereus]